MPRNASPSQRRARRWAAPLAALAFVLAAHASARAVPVAGLTATSKIILFDSDSPGTLFVQTFIIGLQPGERVVGIDFRTPTAQLYAVGSSSRLYTLDPVTGLATPVSPDAFTPALDSAAGIEFGVDFDPVSGKLRVVGDTGQNLLLDPDTGAVSSVGAALVYAAGDANAGQTPSVTAVAYTRNFRNATTTTLYGLDWRRNLLVRVGSDGGAPLSPSTGQTFTVGSLSTGFGVTELAGFDVAASDATAYAAMRSTDALASSVFYTVNLDTGAATQVGTIGGGEFVRDVTALSRPYDLFGVTASHKLLRFSSATPGSIINSVTLGGIPSGERIVATDCFSLKPEVLSLLTDASSFYNYTVATNTLTPIGHILNANHRLSGNEFGFTFWPAGSARVVSDTSQNLIALPVTAVDATTRTPLSYAPGDPNAGAAPRVVGAAFEQKGAGARMFDIDSGLDILARQEVPPRPFDPETGHLFTIGPLGFDTTGAVGFDIPPAQFVIPVNPSALRDDGAFASLTAPGATTSGLFSVNLRTGRATPLGTVGGGEVVGGLAVVDNVGLFRFSPGSYVVNEPDGSVTLTVMRSGDAGVEASVDYETSTIIGDSATQKQDYTFASGTLRFAPGEASKTFKILITDDAHADPGGTLGESFTVTLLNPTAGFGIDSALVGFSGSPGRATVFIDDDEAAPPANQQSPAGAATNPIDDSTFFVRQHYRDFLGRDPDAAGLAFWVGEIESCGANEQCRAVKRENVSAAFFLSIEFQQTGYLVQRLYRAAFKRAPGYFEFMRDTRRLGQGIVVGQAGWEEKMALARQAFAARFVAGAEFKAAFDSKNNAGYVDALFEGAGVTPGAAERLSLISGLDNHTETRATVLLKVADNAAFVRKEFSPAFVLAEYFGYLRRNADQGGFQFWLNKLNQFDGNFISAEMVKAFISSIEYRTRFAP